MALRRPLMVQMLLIYLMNGCSKSNAEVCTSETSIGASSQDWIQWADNVYKVSMNKMPWLEARDACAKIGGVMATPKSKSEGHFFAEITPESNYRHHFWINCNDRLMEG